MGVYKGITALFLRGLTNNIHTTETQIKHALTDHLQTLIEAQGKIGWKAFCYGFLAINWTTTQLQYNNKMKVTTQQTWDKFFTQNVITYVYGIWKFCNDKLHGTNITEEKQLCKKN